MILRRGALFALLAVLGTNPDARADPPLILAAPAASLQRIAPRACFAQRETPRRFGRCETFYTAEIARAPATGVNVLWFELYPKFVGDGEVPERQPEMRHEVIPSAIPAGAPSAGEAGSIVTYLTPEYVRLYSSARLTLLVDQVGLATVTATPVGVVCNSLDRRGMVLVGSCADGC